MSDAINFRTEAKDNPQVKWEFGIGPELWKEMGGHGLSPAEAAAKSEVDELENQLKTAKPVEEHYCNKGVIAEKTDLLHLLDKSFGKESRAMFRDELRHFEARAWANAINKSEIAETYKQIGRILSASGNKPLTPELRKQVASEVIRNCSDPTIISQGYHNTCNVTVVEVRTYSLYPARAAKLVADVATTGEHTTKGGIKVRLDPESMHPDREALRSHSEQGLRAYATQLFNLAAVNIWYSAMKPGTRYEQRENIVKGKPEVAEQLIDYSHAKPVKEVQFLTGEPIDSPYLCDDQIAFISDAIVGKHEPFAVLKSGPSLRILEGEKECHAHATDILNERELPVILEGLKKRHLLPAIASVDTNVEPFNKDSGSGAYGPGGGHVVNLMDYSGGKQPKVALDNEWRKTKDHVSPSTAVDLHDVYLCIAGPAEAAQDATLKAEQARKEGWHNPAAELAAISNDQTRPPGWERNADEIISNDRSAERALVGKQRDRWFDALQTIVNTVNPADKVWLLQRIASDQVCSNEEFGKLVAGATKSVSYQKCIAMANDDVTLRKICIEATTSLAEYLIGLPGTVKIHYFNAMKRD